MSYITPHHIPKYDIWAKNCFVNYPFKRTFIEILLLRCNRFTWWQWQIEKYNHHDVKDEYGHIIIIVILNQNYFDDEVILIDLIFTNLWFKCKYLRNDVKDAITNFVDFNPADFVKYKIDRWIIFFHFQTQHHYD